MFFRISQLFGCASLRSPNCCVFLPRLSFPIVVSLSPASANDQRRATRKTRLPDAFRKQSIVTLILFLNRKAQLLRENPRRAACSIPGVEERRIRTEKGTKTPRKGAAKRKVPPSQLRDKNTEWE